MAKKDEEEKSKKAIEESDVKEETMFDNLGNTDLEHSESTDERNSVLDNDNTDDNQNDDKDEVTISQMK